MQEIKYSIEEIQKLMQEFVATKSLRCDEWYSTEQGLYRGAIEDFIDYIQKDDEREQRRKLYEELKKEFEGK